MINKVKNQYSQIIDIDLVKIYIIKSFLFLQTFLQFLNFLYNYIMFVLSDIILYLIIEIGIMLIYRVFKSDNLNHQLCFNT